MNKIIFDLVPSERLAIIKSQVALVLPIESARTGLQYANEAADIEAQANQLSACIAYYHYGIAKHLFLRLLQTEVYGDGVELLLEEIKEGHNRQLLYQYRAALFFLRTWRPAPAQSSNRSLKAYAHENGNRNPV